ncbi:MAG TPA: bifunctional DNA-formamidopyrimidine glycosylase/DNA-(apurinic or apyrimidinic site) lyase [Candidatus Acidoferrales bacterium]|jgi:formamidopyrimidine-DNA glycosylase|nr:bifunctional DNA-formamidopyrimidine glycosylase/DNA-(apurinic or apyrimidinic site) lyase [Candidatus Acidoferrales bacterium]
MPELPEVETVVRGLKAALPGKRIKEIRFNKTDFIDNPAQVAENLPGKRITTVRRHGKFIVFDLVDSASRSTALLIHLGMTGQLIVTSPEAPISAHTHIFFTLDNGRELRYTDIRRFGRVQFLPEGVDGSALGELGLDALETNESQFIERLRGRKARIKALLLDQRVLRGMGNIYTDESLWRARIHPARIASSLKEDELRNLYKAVQKVLKEAIRLKGSSVSDYVDSDGNRGEFQLRHRVYMRKGEKCFRCGTLIQRMIVAGRSSYFCPHCQPARRTRTKKGSVARSKRR